MPFRFLGVEPILAVGKKQRARSSHAPYPLARRSDDHSLVTRFNSFVSDPAFPCLGAKAAVNAGSACIFVYDQLASVETTGAMARDLTAFLSSEMVRTHEFATFVAICREPIALDEIGFERVLWSQLQQLHQRDVLKHDWDPVASSDPADSHFSFSFEGHALYVVGMHGHSSRLARRFPWPTLVFNLHEQFERLRESGKWTRMRDSIRALDRRLQGSTNPMLSDFGKKSEAAQYSGRDVDANWHAPFKAENGEQGRCPFAWLFRKKEVTQKN